MLPSADFVQPLHEKNKRGRPRSSWLVDAYRDHGRGPESRRGIYYRYAFDRVRVLVVEHGLVPQDDFESKPWPLPLPVLHQLGKASRPEADVLWYARHCLVLRRQGWRTRDLLAWLKHVDEGDR